MERVLRFSEYGYFAISVQKFHKTLALKKFQKPKPDQTFFPRHFPHRPAHRTLDKSSVFIYLNFEILVTSFC